MRLKFLFFPLMLLICVFISIKFILPEFKSLNDANQAKKEAQELLDRTEAKKNAINSLSQKIEEAKEYKDVVYNYLPVRKVEEQVIAGINYLATDAQVFLLDISMGDDASGKPDPLRGVAPVTNVSSETGENTDDAQSKGMLSSKTTIKILGNYENIQLFIDQLQRMALINNLKSLTISKQNDNSSAEKTSGSDSEASQATNLAVDIIIDFGYLEQVKVNEDNLAKFDNNIDDSIIKVLENYTSRKMVTALPSPKGVADGKPNPFFP